MPFLDSSYLPPAVFILTHILGVVGVLYWKSRARGRAGNQLVLSYSLIFCEACEGRWMTEGFPVTLLKGPVLCGVWGPRLSCSMGLSGWRVLVRWGDVWAQLGGSGCYADCVLPQRNKPSFLHFPSLKVVFWIPVFNQKHTQLRMSSSFRGRCGERFWVRWDWRSLWIWCLWGWERQRRQGRWEERVKQCPWRDASWDIGCLCSLCCDGCCSLQFSSVYSTWGS